MERLLLLGIGLALVLTAVASDAPPPDPPAPAAPLAWSLPTSNTSVFAGDSARFFQYTKRRFKGRRWTPWQGGQYGFVRNPYLVDRDTLYGRFHEGVDIRPLYRDARGEPLDTVRAVARGVVAYVNDAPGRSSYGRYVVVEHIVEGTPIYSLYAHLGDSWLTPGYVVRRGEGLGRIGYTGRGIDRERAHLHLEINLLISDEIASWHDEHFRSDNEHGTFNGLNLVGIDPLALLGPLDAPRRTSLIEHVRSLPVEYRVHLPAEREPSIIHRYPWLKADRKRVPGSSWSIGFARSGVPVDARLVPAVSELTIESTPPGEAGCRPYSNRWLVARGDDCLLSRRGRRWLDLYAPSSPLSEVSR